MATQKTQVKTIAPATPQAPKEEAPKVVVIPEKLTKNQKRRIKKFQAKKAAKEAGVAPVLPKKAPVQAKKQEAKPVVEQKKTKTKPAVEQKPKVEDAKSKAPAKVVQPRKLAPAPVEPTKFEQIQADISHFSTLFKQAEKLTKDKETEHYAKLQKDKDGQFYLNMLKQGTMGDKISALSTIVQRNPQCSMSYLTTLVGMSKKKNRKMAELAINAVKDLFIFNLLSDENKLSPFSKNPLLQSKQPSANDLIQSFYEHQLKELYLAFINDVLKPMSHDDLEFHRRFALNTLEELLEKKPELEEQILNILVNKLGDTSKKVQCHVIYLLLKLSQAHMEMTPVIVHEVNLFIARNGTKNTHLYYAVAYLNRISSMVAPKDERVRVMLLRIYFSLFKKLLKTDDKSQEAKVVEPKKDRNRSKKDNELAAKKAKKAAELNGPSELEQEDNKVAELVLKGVNILMSKCSAQLFDSDAVSGSESSSAEMRRLIEEETFSLFTLSHHDVFRISIQALKLLFQFARQSKRLRQNRGEVESVKENAGDSDSINDRYYRALYEVLLRVHLNKPAKLDEFFALVFKSVKADPNSGRVLAFVRRIIQMSTLNEASYTAASLLIVSELIRCKDDLRFQLYSLEQITRGGKADASKNKGRDDSDSEEEHFVDADKVAEEAKTKPQTTEAVQEKDNRAYDPLKREPKYANAESCPIYELVQLTFHTHPTVRLWASNLVSGQIINYNGDPLLDFGLANFLDRIAYKNPKSLDKLAAKGFATSRRMAATEQPVNLIDFKEGQDIENAREEEKYLYKYFQTRGPRLTKKGGEEDSEGDEDIEMADVNSDSDEDPELKAFADKAIKDKMRELNGGEGSDSDDLSALEDDDELNQDSEEEGDDEDMEDDDGDDFFDGEEDLQEVNVKGSDEDGEEFDDEEDSFDEKTGQGKAKQVLEDSEEEMGGDEDEEDEIDYGMEDDEEEDEEDNIFTKSNSKKGGKDSKKKKESSIFASYEEFAHLLEGDSPDGGEKKKPKFGGPKVGFNKSSHVKRDFKKRGSGQKGGPANKRQRK
ncbi:hypothetical protein FGO68_gene17657 [Halteria grandinella]|uniref:CCAAT-binding factor domain-containing protein n=1 Tax=Halteria grandinella TaxID=5974 RepID=A0A8J8P3Y8_HALGN|nr:hypothetical protein FGO68_gene17657 [Halteria grandinella]